MNRPTGVTILAWLAIIGGVLGVFGAIALLFAGIAAMSIGAVAVGVAGVPQGVGAAGAGLFALVMAIWLALLAVVEIIFGSGALGLKPWAWTLGIYWCYIAVVSNVVGLFSRGGLFGAVLGVAIAVAILYYLFTNDVRVAFGKTDQNAPGFLVPVFEQIDKLVASNKGGTRPPAGYQPPTGPTQGSGTPPVPPAPQG